MSDAVSVHVTGGMIDCATSDFTAVTSRGHPFPLLPRHESICRTPLRGGSLGCSAHTSRTRTTLWIFPASSRFRESPGLAVRSLRPFP
jgi:hypothetical protein